MLRTTLVVALSTAASVSGARMVRGSASTAPDDEPRRLDDRSLRGERHGPYRMFHGGVDPGIHDDDVPGEDAGEDEYDPAVWGEYDGAGVDELSPEDGSRIIGGYSAGTTRFKYIVSMKDRIGHFCGGSLIAPDVVLTAAHCQGGSYDVYVNHPKLNTNSGQKMSKKKELPHPNYDSRGTNNDFMLVFLNSEVNMNQASLVRLNSNSNFPVNNAQVTVMGFGDTDPRDSVSKLSNELNRVEVNIISNSDCEDSEGRIDGAYDNYFNQITSSMICARRNSRDACQGDSGGPLVRLGNMADGSGDTQVGIVSWGVGCADPNFPGVYARVSSAFNWISKEVCNRSISRNIPSYFGCDPPPPASSPSNQQQQQQNNQITASSSNTNTQPITASVSAGTWTTLVDENFINGFGPNFQSGGRHVRHIRKKKNRTGIVNIQNGQGQSSSLLTKNINVQGKKNFRVTIAFMGIGMGLKEKFCVDYATNNNNWKQSKCFIFSNQTYNNKKWYDVQATFNARTKNLKVRVRCKGNHNNDDILIDRVRIQGK